ncbi:MAG TPA: D-tagatose-bisphosphate aldolase, class II, non-catalytic subunit [Burkholderiaceae bacterium]
MKAILDFVRQHKQGLPVGLYSICSAHPIVIEAAMRSARDAGQAVLIEATSNQVNQHGGYTGMAPRDFHAFVMEIADRVGLPRSDVWLGGDHLGPNCWVARNAAEAMALSMELIERYVEAGFRKIHLDCSMSCADDPSPLDPTVAAQRAASLCVVAERTWKRAGGEAPVYVIGTEVPVPGGAAESLHGIAVTTPAAARATIAAHRDIFLGQGLSAAWSRVVALVVQPGVEFDHRHVIDYRPGEAERLSAFIGQDERLVYEAHSTDYQTPGNLARLVSGHFAILKVGPALSFALRETLWALADIESEWLGKDKASGFKEVVLRAMRENPVHWQKYYHDPDTRQYDLQYSLSDRIRYYWSQPDIGAAQAKMFANLDNNPPPLALLSQYLTRQYEAIREGRLVYSAHEILMHAIRLVIDQYRAACRPDSLSLNVNLDIKTSI